MATRLLSPEDIYDVYGLEWVMTADVDDNDERLIEFRLSEIRDAYVHACKSRIRAEAQYLGVRLREDFTFEELMDVVREHLRKTLVQAPPMGGNVMATILQAHQMAGTNLDGIDLVRFGLAPKPAAVRPDVDPNWFMNTGNSNGRMFNDPKWAEIAKAYTRIESAQSIKEMIAAIDGMNQLQHNSFHVLIDLQTGRMLNDYTNATTDRDARQRLQEVLDIKRNSRSVTEFVDSMSKEVRDLLHKYRKVMIQIAV